MFFLFCFLFPIIKTAFSALIKRLSLSDWRCNTATPRKMKQKLKKTQIFQRFILNVIKLKLTQFVGVTPAPTFLYCIFVLTAFVVIGFPNFCYYFSFLFWLDHLQSLWAINKCILCHFIGLPSWVLAWLSQQQSIASPAGAARGTSLGQAEMQNSQKYK